MMRFAARTSLLTFGVIALLLGGVLMASGAFRPVRFFVAASAIERNQPLMLVSDRGETLILTPHNRLITAFENRILWHTDSGEIAVWENGKQEIETLWPIVPQNVEWSPQGMVVWEEFTVDAGYIAMLWDGTTSYRIAPEARSVIDWQWISDSVLLWLQIGDDGGWDMMRWEEGVVTALPIAEIGERLSDGRIFECGTAVLKSLNNFYLYSEGQLTQLPAGINSIDDIQTDDCQSYLIQDVENINDQYDTLWNGTSDVQLSFQAQHIQGSEVLGSAIDELSPNQLTLIRQHGDSTLTQNWNLPFSVHTPILLFWEGSSSVWNISQPGEIHLLLWNHETNQIQEYITPMGTNGSYRTDEIHGRAAWFAWTELSTIQLTTWQDQQLRQHTLSISANPDDYPSLHWMNDGTLLLGIAEDDLSIEDQAPKTHFYQWDGQQLHALTILPPNTVPFSDWMTWE